MIWTIIGLVGITNIITRSYIFEKVREKLHSPGLDIWHSALPVAVPGLVFYGICWRFVHMIAGAVFQLFLFGVVW